MSARSWVATVRVGPNLSEPEALLAALNQVTDALGVERDACWPTDAPQLVRERLAELRELLALAADTLDNYADADCTGDPPRYQPNEAMLVAEVLRHALGAPLTGGES